MDIITYAACQKIAASALSGISSIQAQGTSLVISTKDGQTVKIDFPKPKDGVGVSNININNNNQLEYTLTDGTVKNAGTIKTIKGERGERGIPGEKGKDGITPIKGVDYFTSDDINSVVNQVIQELPEDEENNATTEDIDNLFKDMTW